MTALTRIQDPQAIGEVLSRSGYFSDARDAAQAAVKVMAGAELGFPPIQSMMGVYIVKGKVTLSANLMAAAIKRHPAYTFRVKEHTAQACTIDFIENGEVIGTSSFSMDDAKSANLTGNDTWRKFPKNMLYARALSNGAKWYCPDVFGGPIYTPDELGAQVDGETGELIEGTAVPYIVPKPEPVSDIDNKWEPDKPKQIEAPAEDLNFPPVEDLDLVDEEFCLIATDELKRQKVPVPDFRKLLEESGLTPPSDLGSREKRLAALKTMTLDQSIAFTHALARRAKAIQQQEAA